MQMAVFLAALDQTVVTTALPTMTRNLKALEADHTWVGSAYLLAGAAAIPLWGKVSDKSGRKPIVLFANTVFVRSLIRALSYIVEMPIGFRVVQVAEAGGLVILVTVSISDMFSMRKERSQHCQV